jgi:hypothetical protein
MCERERVKKRKMRESIKEKTGEELEREREKVISVKERGIE